MLEAYYFVRDENNAPRMTVCLLKEGDAVSRGVSLCSMKDNPIKKIGKIKAKGRAMAALKTGKNNSVISRYEAFDLIDEIELVNDVAVDIDSIIGYTSTIKEEGFSSQCFKSLFNPKLSEFETKLLEKASTRDTDSI